SRADARCRSTTSPSRGRRCVRGWSPERVAQAAGGRLTGGGDGGPRRTVIDSRSVGPGDLFVGLTGERVDGGAYAAAALEAGAWGVLVGPGHEVTGGACLVAGDPLLALQRLA